MNNKKRLKALVLSMGLGVAMLTATSVQAQVINLLDEYYDELDQANQGALLKGRGSSDYNNNLSLHNFGVDQDSLTLQNFGEAPLGSGWFVFVGAGFSYAALKSRKKHNTKKKQNQK